MKKYPVIYFRRIPGRFIISLLAAMFLAAFSRNALGMETFDLSLSPGWNLVSIPIVADDNSVEGVFQGKNQGVVWEWQALAEYYRGAQSIEPGRGYWVFVPAPLDGGAEQIDLTITGELPSKASVTLRPGWNLIGPLPGYQYFEDLLLLPWKWDPAANGYAAPGAQAWTPGAGYWLHASRIKVVDFSTYSLSGQLTGNVVEGVVMTLLNAAGIETSTTTAPDGSYSFSGLRSGVYRVTPGATGRDGTSFTPESRFSIIIEGASISGVDFAADDAVADTSFLELTDPGTQTFSTDEFAAAANVSTLTGPDVVVNDEEGTIRVSGNRRDAFAAGDVLIGDATTRFAKVVTAVEAAGNDIVLRVRNATLPEIMADGSSFGFAMTPDWANAEDLLAAERGSRGRSGLNLNQNGSISLDNFSLLDLHIKNNGGIDWANSSIMQAAVKPAERNSAVRQADTLSPGGHVGVTIITGLLQVVPTTSFNYNYSLASGITAEGSVNAQIITDFDIEANFSGEFSAHLGGTLLKVNAPIVFPTSPPIYVDVEFEIPAGVIFNASTDGTIQFRQRSEHNLRVSLGYSGATGFTATKTLRKSHSNNEFVQDITGCASAEMYLEPTVSVKLYKVAGPYISLRPYLRGEICEPPELDQHELFLGISGAVGFELDYLLGSLNVSSGPLFDLYKSWDLVGPRTAGTYNSPPVATNQTVQVPNGKPKSIILTGTDADRDRLVYSLVNYPSHGNFSALNSGSGQINYAPKAGYSGADAFTFRVFDGSEYSEPATVSLDITGAQPPAIAFNVNSNGLAVSFDASVSSDPVDALASLQVRWDFTNDGIWDSGWSNSKTANHTYPASGTFVAVCEGRNTAGVVSRASRVVAAIAGVSNSTPEADFSTVLNGLIVAVDASASHDPEDAAASLALQYRWAWTDNGTWTGWSTTPTASHAYSAAGTYKIQLQAQDNDGNIGQRFVSVTVPGMSESYLVIDIAAGPDALEYPVSNLTAVPAGGWTDEYKTTKIVLRRLPAGSFIMGSPEDEFGRYTSDETQHSVTLTQDFYIGVFEITQKQWERVMGNWPSYLSNSSVRDARPVEKVSYYEVREDAGSNSAISPNWPQSSQVGESSFMGKLREKTGLAFDLPTESQWEYACRAGTITALNNGTNLTGETEDENMNLLGRYFYNHPGGLENYDYYDVDLSGGTAKAGSYVPNDWGLYDMHGNVSEMCLDWYDGTYPGAVTDPPGVSSSSYRAARGGSWYGNATNCRAAYRFVIWPDQRSNWAGFRAALIAGQAR